MMQRFFFCFGAEKSLKVLISSFSSSSYVCFQVRQNDCWKNLVHVIAVLKHKFGELHFDHIFDLQNSKPEV